MEYAGIENGVHEQLLERVREPYCDGLGLTGWLRTAVLPDGKHEITVEPFDFIWLGQTFTVPKGFVTDGASVPWLFQRILPKHGDAFVAAVVHDFLYVFGLVSRRQADNALIHFSRLLGVSWHDRKMLWVGVRLGGWRSWNAYRRREAKIEAR